MRCTVILTKPTLVTRTSYNAVARVDRNVELGRGDKIAFIDVAPTAGARSQESRESNGWALEISAMD